MRHLEKAIEINPSLGRYIVTRMDTRHLTQLVYRFAHQTASGRGDFTETLFWQPFLVTDEKGEAAVEFDDAQPVGDLARVARRSRGHLGAVPE